MCRKCVYKEGKQFDGYASTSFLFERQRGDASFSPLRVARFRFSFGLSTFLALFVERPLYCSQQ